MSLAQRLFAAFDLRATSKWFALSVLTGIIAGLGAMAFTFLGHVIVRWTLFEIAGFVPRHAGGEPAIDLSAVPPDFSWLLLIGIMAAGGLVSGFLVYTFAPEAEGHGTDAAIDAFHNKRGYIRPRIPIIKLLASAVTIGTGGSGGREGPIAQIGAGFGSYLATRLKLPVRDRRILMAAGIGAGVGAIFRAPLAGAIFAGEILYRDADLESDVIVPAAIASIVSYTVYSLCLPDEFRFVPVFGQHLNHTLGSFFDLIPMGLMSLVLVGVGILYIRVFYGTQALFKRFPIIPHLRPAIGVTMAGLVALVTYFAMGRDDRTLAVLSTGYGSLQMALENSGKLGIGLLLVIAFVKILTTSLTIGSGGSGGVFGPSMVIGGCLGAAMGEFFHIIWPNLSTPPEAFAIVGMAGFFAGCAHAPISTIIMVSELTGDYRLLLPTMWVSTICFLLCKRWTLYEMQVATRIESPAHRGDFIIDLLEGFTVNDVFRRDHPIMFVDEGMSLKDIVHLLAETRQPYFPVVDPQRRIVGIFSADDVRSYLYDETIWELAVARDIMTTKIVSVVPSDDLNTALQRFTAINVDELPVMDPEQPGKMLGVLRRKDTIAFYNRRLTEHKISHSD